MKKHEVMTMKVYNHENMKLTGVMTEDMIKELGIPMEQTKMHGVVKLPKETFNLYEVPAPYNEMEVFYGNTMELLRFVPSYYFSSVAIRKFELTPIGEDEIGSIVCSWKTEEIPIGEFNRVYNRKNEEKYRLRFLMDPKFDPREWEAEKRRKKYPNLKIIH